MGKNAMEAMRRLAAFYETKLAGKDCRASISDSAGRPSDGRTAIREKLSSNALRRLAETKLPDCAGFWFVFKAR
jgi:hypothetical protein